MDSLFRPGDIINLDCWYYVYELIDDYGLVFYVGMSRDPASRFRSHANPRHCDSEAVCAEIAVCKKPTMRIVSVHPSKEEALRAEAARVRETPGLLNDNTKYGITGPKKRTAEYYRARSLRRKQRDASKVQEMASIGEGRPPAPSPGP